MENRTEIDIQQLDKLRLLASIAEMADNSILILDGDGHIQWANNGFEQLYGYTLEEFSDLETIDNSDFIRKLQEADRLFFKNHLSLSFSKQFITKTGIRKWVQSTLTPVKDSLGNVERFIVIETDITQQKEIEEELVQRQENSQTLSEHLESVKNYVEDQIIELNEQKRAIELAKEKSEEVLQKVLPYEIAIQLKKKGFAAPRHYKKVSVIHLNIRNFLNLSDLVPIEELVQQLHQSVVEFDSILESHYVEKIKSSGGMYIGAGGVPLRNRSNPIDVVLSAFQLNKAVERMNIGRLKNQLPAFETGIGIHTGKVIAGVVGKNKLTYDIWGDTVNLAGMVESLCPSGEICISEVTKMEVNEFFEFTPLQKISTGVGERLQLFKVNRIKPLYSEDKTGHSPNQEFVQILSKL